VIQMKDCPTCTHEMRKIYPLSDWEYGWKYLFCDKCKVLYCYRDNDKNPCKYTWGIMSKKAQRHIMNKTLYTSEW
jgi:hypothetical protein